ncbi:hypothetical protein BBK36DRAFT_1162584 [Trichoderma citrinoviride]|uniref:Uncharacterized protein n=1 Tax=Trichoderma citrinoviride TaxID=58853 RepID=A0A2T4B0F7_9HYPO|nr:hypothetical protein BBK36DRAFT_1162584 [Trichoderma citrinoviride]PTB62802.1 hypothetical protein BBK36DRAFT_1162584 [Trichoderma citrinoviride]
MLWHRVAAILLLAAGRTALAQRSDNESICDYYAAKRYGESNATTQLLLVQSIVTLAYAGGHDLLPGAYNGTTGIFNQGSYEGADVFLRPWFDGSKATTNLNNQPVGIDWLDGGATGPLLSFLNGSTGSVEIDKSTNQYRLFTHWFTAFGFVYGCSLAPKFPRTGDSGGPLSPAYVHKFMNLNQTHIGYFIEQLTLASMAYGFSSEDAQTLSTFMNARYNVRCAPAINGQLFSICFADECPLAQPKPDCDAYKEIGPSGTGNGSEPTATAGPGSATNSATTTSISPGSPTAAAGDAGTGRDASSSSAALSGGAIAGIAIGGAAVLLLAVGLLLYFRRRSAKPHLVPVPVPSDGGYGSPAHPTHSYYSSNPHMSMASTIPPEAYMGGHNPVPGFWSPPKPQEIGHGGHEPMAVPRPATMSPPIAEMESP